MRTKKKYIVYITTAILVVVFVAITIWYFSPKTFLKDRNSDDISSISIFNGSTGKNFVIEDAGEIEYIISNIQNSKWYRSGISSFHDGYSFNLTFKDKDGKEIDSFIINNQYLIRDDPFFYKSTEVPLCYDYLQALENKYTELPQRPENTTLEFWITENVDAMDLSKYQKVYDYPSDEVRTAFYGAGYSSVLDSAGNEIKPEHYVLYGVGAYPNNSTSNNYITLIEITDPSVYLYGLSVECSADEFDQTFEALGFEIQIQDKSETRIERYAIKDGIVIVFTKKLTKGSFAIVPVSTFWDLW